MPDSSGANTANAQQNNDSECNQDIKCLENTHARVAEIEDLKLDTMPNLEQLLLRQNLIQEIRLPKLLFLKELDLYDNRISKIDNLEQLINLEMLDLSFNKIKKIENLDKLVKLKELYFVSNRITLIENLTFNHLTTLELGDNKIKKIENLDNLNNLQNLWLGKNRIAKLENLDKLVNLKILSIQGNRIAQIEGISALANLEELYLGENLIEEIANLDNNKKIRIIDLSNNKLTKVANLQCLAECLEEIWLNSNNIQNIESVDLGKCKKLKTIYLEYNPVQTNDLPNYRRKVKLHLPQLEQIDATLCTTFNKYPI